ncbi:MULTISPECIES: sugar phosphate isomerase/epimerase [Thermococcus]|nr:MULTISPECIES: sugar phosphate isomerase/epimerase [Thermococcus]KUK18506.1 MAG: putative AP endonuclease [Thermococcus sibiricus]KUK29147.1 MAG: putative AP endonuclease [Thermococcus sp. 40_45]MBC7094054.1 sugar phosphate isomerase/epimerase [Thermococcus sp.]HII66966.1 sugar phosphate isomerase/epimerase [Thermococcaceae archaeon]
MKVGVNSYIIREISGNGFSIDELPIDVIELGFDGLRGLTDKGIDWDVLHGLLTLDVEFTLHAPTSDGRNIRVDLCVNSRKNIEIMENVFEIARTLDAKYVVVHGGDIKDSYHKALVNTRKQMMELSAVAEEYGVKLVIENLIDNRIGAFPHELIPFLEENVSVCFDIGHAFINSLKYGLGVEEYMLLPGIEHVHLHDNNGAKDEHRALGEGRINFDDLIPKILSLRPKNVIWEIRDYWDRENVLRSILSVKRVKYVRPAFPIRVSKRGL